MKVAQSRGLGDELATLTRCLFYAGTRYPWHRPLIDYKF